MANGVQTLPFALDTGKIGKHAMPIYSGSHELYGKFSLKRRSADVLAEWLATQSYENDFDKRDARLWIERIAVTDGNEIEAVLPCCRASARCSTRRTTMSASASCRCSH